MENTEGGFYFSLPRICARLAGAAPRPVESNGWEAALAGGLFHGVAYFFLARLLQRDLAPAEQAWWLLPLAILLWFLWLALLFLNSLVLRLLRAMGIFRQTPAAHAQEIFIVLLLSGAALSLLSGGFWSRLAGGFWLAALSVNLAARLLLFFLPRNGTAAP